VKNYIFKINRQGSNIALSQEMTRTFINHSSLLLLLLHFNT